MQQMYLLYTGGTFGMIHRPGKPLAPAPIEDVWSHLPDWQCNWYHIPQDMETPVYDVGDAIYANCAVTLATTRQPIDSSNMNPADWQILAQAIADNYEEYDGFVIIHGTDTMAYTASALSFMLAGLGKPVVCTGAQRPIDQADSDARNNLNNALQVATQSTIAEVMIVFGQFALRGNRSVKTSTSKDDAFVSPNYPPLIDFLLPFAHTQQGVTLHKKMLKQKQLSQAVALLWLYPGIDMPEVIKGITTPHTKALVILCYGDGHLPKDQASIALLRTLSESGVVLVSLSQCAHHPNTIGRYAVGAANIQAGVIDGGDTTLEATVTKLMWALANHDNLQGIQQAIQSNICGERTV